MVIDLGLFDRALNDARDGLDHQQVALNLGMERRFVLHMPLMWIDKAQTWMLAHDLGGAPLVDLLVERTHTCYLGDRGHRHLWGHGCGECPACRLRRDGFLRYRAENAERTHEREAVHA
jgi:7-cyano-7-deazaguanine synthase